MIFWLLAAAGCIATVIVYAALVVASLAERDSYRRK
jgi:hypothetical protein